MSKLAPGDTAPDFTLPSDDRTEVSLRDYRGLRPIVYFYPAASTPGCTREAHDFQDALEDLTSAGYRVIGISPDDPEKIAKFRTDGGFTFPLLSDPEREVLTEWGAFGEKMLYGKPVTGVIRSTFVLTPDGTVEPAFYNVRASGHVAKLRRDLKI